MQKQILFRFYPIKSISLELSLRMKSAFKIHVSQNQLLVGGVGPVFTFNTSRARTNHSIFDWNSSVVIPRISSVKYIVISGELVVKRKLQPVSIHGEKKRGEMMEGRQSWLVGGWGRLKKALFQFWKRARERFSCLLLSCCQTRSAVRSSDAARLPDSPFAQWSLRGPTMHFTFNLALPGTWLSGSASTIWDKTGGGGQWLGLWKVLREGGL